MYSAAGHGLYMQFTRPFPSFAEVGLACETKGYLRRHNLPVQERNAICKHIATAGHLVC